MPSRRLPQTPEQVTKYTVLGSYVEGSNSHFVRHVAILRDDANLYYACPGVEVCHMAPPLVAGPVTAAANPEKLLCQPHIAGGITLDADDIEGIQTWLSVVDKEKRPSIMREEYIVYPAMQWVYSENGARQYRRYSCVGFVLDCYRSIGVNLIEDSNRDSLPEVDIEAIATAYGESVRIERWREKFGIPGGGPWRIVLAGYIFHSLSRDDDSIRSTAYLPANGDERNYTS